MIEWNFAKTFDHKPRNLDRFVLNALNCVSLLVFLIGHCEHLITSCEARYVFSLHIHVLYWTFYKLSKIPITVPWHIHHLHGNKNFHNLITFAKCYYTYTWLVCLWSYLNIMSSGPVLFMNIDSTTYFGYKCSFSVNCLYLIFWPFRYYMEKAFYSIVKWEPLSVFWARSVSMSAGWFEGR